VCRQRDVEGWPNLAEFGHWKLSSFFSPMAAKETILDVDTIRELLGNKVSERIIRKFAKKQKIFRCMQCPRCCPSLPLLLEHLTEKKHFYGKQKLFDYKKEFLKELNSTRTPPISKWSKCHKFYDEMKDYQQEEYVNLLWLTVLQKRFSWQPAPQPTVVSGV
jgi:hypothetical protein